ncbi:MAG: hypothetical protein JWO30_4940 [Fibrobacteres bacterium]|nr:hypothetical protein [Fibrobacterota bacterium]
MILSAGRIHAAIADAAHPDFDLTEVPFPSKFKTMGISFLKDGRMVLSVTDFVGGGQVEAAKSAAVKVYLVSGYDGTAAASVKMEEISNTWYQLVGLVVAEEKVYVSDRDGFYQILQLAANAAPAQNRKLIVKWPDENTWNTTFQWHQFVFTPIYNKGFFYAPYSGSIRGGGPSDANPTSHMSGGFLKWDLATAKLEAIAGGFRSPNGANLDSATGEMFVADNQGSWLPSSTFARILPGKFYGHRQVPQTLNSAGAVTATHPPNWAEGLPYDPPVAWLPHGDVRASPSQPVRIRSGKYAGDWLMGDVNNPGLIRVGLDKVGDGYNGAVFFFSKGTKNSAINRLAWGPDGALYMGTLSTISGNWPNGNDNAFYRLAPKPAATAFEMKAVRSLSDGLELEFTQPVNPAAAAADFSAEQWQYIRQPGYGEGRQPTQRLTVAGAEISADGLRVHLKIAGLIPDRVVHVKHAGLASAAGKTAWNDETWFTHNYISTRSWSAATAVRESGRTGATSAGALKVRNTIRGILSAAIEAEGPWQAVLTAPDGTVLARASGIGASEITLRHAPVTGVGILSVRFAGGVLARKVCF